MGRLTWECRKAHVDVAEDRQGRLKKRSPSCSESPALFYLFFAVIRLPILKIAGTKHIHCFASSLRALAAAMHSGRSSNMRGVMVPFGRRDALPRSL